ncbi:anamorsin homolog [Planococcus citri]|uniref:anamorsin homolog n=1 Tax=Planococcus citri TaxID=170843 RepID=UPI0031F77957
MDCVLEIESNEKLLLTEGISNFKSLLPAKLNNSCTFSDSSSLSNLNDKFDIIVSLNVNSCNLHDSSVLLSYSKLLKPGGRFVIYQIVQESDQGEQLKKNLVISGFVNIDLKPTKRFSIKFDDCRVDEEFHGCSGKEILYIQSEKPHYEVGSFKTLSISKLQSNKADDVAAVWKLDDDEEDYINADDLLDEDDLKKPDPSSLKVCGTTGKRKACKGCSCGLAEELEQEANKNKDTSQAKSSCGNCYLGDAFRCASCPYLGMPAFKPGEKVELSDQFLSPDI